MARPELPAFDLVVATVGRTTELDGLLASLDRQTYRGFRVLLVDQNEDDRVAPVLAAHPGLDLLRLRSERGLSRARNRALPELRADVVAFPDDDCVYPENLLERLAYLFARRPDLDGVLGRAADRSGRSSRNWARDRGQVTRDGVWHRSNSNSVFLRCELIDRAGRFDESLGLGSSTPWSSGEETEYLVRAVDLGARIEYDPELVVFHRDEALTPELGLRDGASVGYILAKHHFRARTVGRMLVRPLGGALLALFRLDGEGARFQLAALRGRVAGYRAGLRAGRGAR